MFSPRSILDPGLLFELPLLRKGDTVSQALEASLKKAI